MAVVSKTTASVPKSVASEYSKASKPHAVAEADGDGYTKTAPMKKAQKPGGSKQFGLPKSGVSKTMRMSKRHMPGC